MSSPHQNASFQRKLIYFGMILGLFVVTLFLRGVVSLEAKPSTWTIQGQAENLEITERNQGKAELAGSAIRLLLTGSRGFAISILWIAAIDKQKKDEWNELEVLVDSITQLQPHFITPWLFQSWNLTYNVSVEMDRLNDMYFYIGRGILLLARGETVNKRNPDLRYQLGFYYQNKFGVSDKVNTLRCLLQLSCMPPDERNPARLLNSDRTVNLDEFQKFCDKNPQLIRRLRDTLNYEKPEEIVDFLRSNEKVPSRYVEGRLADRMAQWPVLPPSQSEEELLPTLPINDATADGYRVGRAWFGYSREVIPPPDGKPSATPMPDEYDTKLYRIPRQPALIIFRQGYPRAQTYIAERLQNEGWFDKTPWVIDEGFLSDPQRRWFNNQVVRIEPNDEGHSLQAWLKAYELWKDHGRKNGLDLEQSEESRLERNGKLYGDLKGFIPGTTIPPPPSSEERSNQELMDSYDACKQLIYFKQNIQMTNYLSFRDAAQAESDPLTIRARQLLYEANRKRTIFADRTKAKELYEQAFDEWKKVFNKYPRLQSDRLDKYQEELYAANIDYVLMLRDDNQPIRRRAVLGIFDIMESAAMATIGHPLAITPTLLDLEQSSPANFASVEPLPVYGPLDKPDANGQNLINEFIKQKVRETKGLARGMSAGPSGGPAPPPKIDRPVLRK